MSLKSEEVRDDFLKSFGVTNPRPYEEDEEEDLSPEDEQFLAEGPEEPEVPVPDEEEKEEEEVPSTLDLLARERIPEPQKREEQSEVDRLKQQLSELEGRLNESVRKTEESIKTEEPEEDFEDFDWTSPQVAQVFAEQFDIDIDEAKHMAAISGNIATAITKSTVGKKIESIEAERQAEKEERKREQLMRTSWDNLTKGLAHAEQRGKLEKEIVEQWRRDKQRSLLAYEFSRSPQLMFSQEDVVRTVLAIARDVELAETDGKFAKVAEDNTENAESVTGTRTKAKAPSPDNKQKLSPEDEIRKQIMGSSFSHARNLPEGFR